MQSMFNGYNHRVAREGPWLQILPNIVHLGTRVRLKILLRSSTKENILMCTP